MTEGVSITIYLMMYMSWSYSAYHGHLMSLKQLSTHKMAQTGLQKEPPPNVCIVSEDFLADDSAPVAYISSSHAPTQHNMTTTIISGTTDSSI